MRKACRRSAQLALERFSAAAMRSRTGDGCRTATARGCDGSSSARFCAPRRRIAEMKASFGFPVRLSANAIGVALETARHRVRRRHHRQRHGSGREQQQRQAGDVVHPAQAGRSGHQPQHQRREIEAGRRSARSRTQCPSRCRRERDGRSRARAPDLDLVVRRIRRASCPRRGLRRGTADAGERGIGLLRLLAEPPLVRAQHVSAGALGQRASSRGAQRIPIERLHRIENWQQQCMRARDS